MGKRSTFDRKDKDFYETPQGAVEPLIDHLPEEGYYVDPCAGNGAIEFWLKAFTDLNIVEAYDLFVHLYEYDCLKADATSRIYPDSGDYFITNPPWDRKILHPIIDNLAGQKPTWLLFDADWMHTKQSSEYMKYCVKIVSIGRVKWFPDSNSVGKDNCCWYLFDKNFTGATEFIGR